MKIAQHAVTRDVNAAIHRSWHRGKIPLDRGREIVGVG